MDTIWGIDLGGTKIECALLDAAKGYTIISRKRVPTEGSKGYQHVLNQVEHCIRLVEEESGVKADKIGIGTPGTLDPSTGLLKNCNSIYLNGMPFAKDLSAQLGIPVSIANDANCFAVAEAKMGIVRDECPEAEVVFGVIMGTGVGGGLIVNGKVINGRHGIGGEWGHNFLDASGGECYCGRIGCVETLLSGPGLEKYYASKAGKSLALKDIVQAYRDKTDAYAVETMERLFYYFGKGIANVINIIDPDAIVIGGGVGNIDEIYTHGVEAIKRFIFNPIVETKVLKPKLGDSAGVFGAAML